MILVVMVAILQRCNVKKKKKIFERKINKTFKYKPPGILNFSSLFSPDTLAVYHFEQYVNHDIDTFYLWELEFYNLPIFPSNLLKVKFARISFSSCKMYALVTARSRECENNLKHYFLVLR